mgnify:CR=1 FL=1|tara:strand:- start:158 stop:607 length:450 start_codon:yes stop_codon:yes gene_type:complete
MSKNSNKALDLELSPTDLRDLINGLDRIKDKFSERGANTQINKIVFDAAKPMTSIMKATAPVDETKILKKSVGRWKTKTGVRVGARYRKKDKNKGWYVAFAAYSHKTPGGGMTSKATPFLADAYESTKELTGKLILDGVNKLISKFWRS